MIALTSSTRKKKGQFSREQNAPGRQVAPEGLGEPKDEILDPKDAFPTLSQYWMKNIWKSMKLQIPLDHF